MSYYKITYESDTLDGLKAMQGNSVNQGVAGSDSAGLDTPAPPTQPGTEGADIASDAAPTPPLADSMDLAAEGSSLSPPPETANSFTADVGGEVQPPPLEGSASNGNDSPSPPEQAGGKGPKSAK